MSNIRNLVHLALRKLFLRGLQLLAVQCAPMPEIDVWGRTSPNHDRYFSQLNTQEKSAFIHETQEALSSDGLLERSYRSLSFSIYILAGMCIAMIYYTYVSPRTASPIPTSVGLILTTSFFILYICVSRLALRVFDLWDQTSNFAHGQQLPYLLRLMAIIFHKLRIRRGLPR